MKIRTDFVTNSSSSSFICFDISNKELVDAFQDFGFNYMCKAGAVQYSNYFEDDLAPDGPNGGSISKWLATFFENNSNEYFLKDFDATGLANYLRSNADLIDKSTRRAVIESGSVITDDSGTEYCLEERKEGKIFFSNIDDSKWDYSEQGIALWQLLNSGVDNRIKEYARNHVSREIEDPWNSENKNDRAIFHPEDLKQFVEFRKYELNENGIVEFLNIVNNGISRWSLFYLYTLVGLDIFDATECLSAAEQEDIASLGEDLNYCLRINPTDALYAVSLLKVIDPDTVLNRIVPGMLKNSETIKKSREYVAFIVQNVPDKRTAIVKLFNSFLDGISSKEELPSEYGRMTDREINAFLKKNYLLDSEIDQHDIDGTFSETDKTKRKKTTVTKPKEKPKKVKDELIVDNKEYTIVDGVLVKYKSDTNSVVIPEGVRIVSGDAFPWEGKRTKNITSISMPDSVLLFENMETGYKKIKNISFSNNLVKLNDIFSNSSMETLEIPSSVEMVVADFDRVKKLKEIVLPESVKYCSTMLGGSIERVVIKAPEMNGRIRIMDDANNITIVVPKNCTEYYQSIISFDARIPTILEDNGEVVVTHNNGDYLIKDGILLRYQNEVDKELRDLTLPDGITIIADEFKGKSKFYGVKKIVVPEGVTYIGTAALMYVGEIVLPDSLTVISGQAFSYCGNRDDVEELIIPKNVKYIGEYAFGGSHFSRIIINSEDFLIGQKVFEDCFELKEVVCTKSNKSIIEKQLKQSANVKQNEVTITTI